MISLQNVHNFRIFWWNLPILWSFDENCTFLVLIHIVYVFQYFLTKFDFFYDLFTKCVHFSWIFDKTYNFFYKICAFFVIFWKQLCDFCNLFTKFTHFLRFFFTKFVHFLQFENKMCTFFVVFRQNLCIFVIFRQNSHFSRTFHKICNFFKLKPWMKFVLFTRFLEQILWQFKETCIFLLNL